MAIAFAGMGLLIGLPPGMPGMGTPLAAIFALIAMAFAGIGLFTGLALAMPCCMGMPPVAAGILAPAGTPLGTALAIGCALADGTAPGFWFGYPAAATAC